MVISAALKLATRDDCEQKSGRAARQSTNRQEILITHWSDIANVERDQRLRTPRSSDELNLKSFGAIHLYHSAEIATSKSSFRKITIQNHSVEFLVAHHDSPGNAVTNCGYVSPWRTIHTVTRSPRRPEGPTRVPRTSYF